MAPTAVQAPAPEASLSVFDRALFKGKVLFATGGGSGLGKDMVLTMMRHGANAVIVGRNAERLAQTAAELEAATGQRCIPAPADVRKLASLNEAAKLTIDTFGKIDFCICGAAGNFLAPLSALSENAFKTVIEIDTIGTFNTYKATIPHIRKSHGAYLHISASLHYKGMVFQAHVSAAKAAVDALNQVIAIEEGPWGVRSNVLVPGPIADTPGMSRLSSLDDPASRKMQVPLGRLGARGDISNAALFLFSPAANYITGTLLVVDGGEQHTRSGTNIFPYPESVLDFESVKKMVPRL
ncbi:2,4-dienoyl-CoA reductase [Auriculariales sp. MPI-PUGE-AT-0066]|nr:2,4-dienoyl-CoA reductase [Auriculariales sp. MPI-PUGE-AT-0066]